MPIDKWRGLLLGGMLLLALACAPGASKPAPPAVPAGSTSAASGGDAAASSMASSAALQRLVDGARQEGSLSFAWGQGTLGGTEGIRRLAEGFNKAYGLNLDVKFTPGPNMAEMAPRIA